MSTVTGIPSPRFNGFSAGRPWSPSPILDAAEAIELQDFDRLGIEPLPIFSKDPARQVSRLALRDRKNNVRIPRPSVVAVVIRGPRRMVGMGMVIPHHIQPPRTSCTAH